MWACLCSYVCVSSVDRVCDGWPRRSRSVEYFEPSQRTGAECSIEEIGLRRAPLGLERHTLDRLTRYEPHQKGAARPPPSPERYGETHHLDAGRGAGRCTKPSAHWKSTARPLASIGGGAGARRQPPLTRLDVIDRTSLRLRNLNTLRGPDAPRLPPPLPHRLACARLGYLPSSAIIAHPLSLPAPTAVSNQGPGPAPRSQPPTPGETLSRGSREASCEGPSAA